MKTETQRRQSNPTAAAVKERKSENYNEIQKRLERHHDELRWLYMELYENDSMFAELLENMKAFWQERDAALKDLDESREANPGWYRQNDMLGMMLYIDNFAGDMKGVKARLDYIGKCNVNYIHLMPFLETPEGRSDGGYAVSDFRKVQEKLGTMEDLDLLEQLGETMQDSSLCALGKSAPNPVLTTLKYFREEYEAHIREHRCGAGVCKALIRYVVDPIKCKGCTRCARGCPTGAIEGAVRAPHTINQAKCIKCGACIDQCRFDAIIKQ